MRTRKAAPACKRPHDSELCSSDGYERAECAFERAECAFESFVVRMRVSKLPCATALQVEALTQAVQYELVQPSSHNLDTRHSDKWPSCC